MAIVVSIEPVVVRGPVAAIQLITNAIQIICMTDKIGYFELQVGTIRYRYRCNDVNECNSSFDKKELRESVVDDSTGNRQFNGFALSLSLPF